MWKWLTLLLLHVICYWGTATFAWVYFEGPKKRYALHTSKALWECTQLVLWNQLLWGPLSTLLLLFYWGFMFPTTSYWWLPLQFTINAIIGDALFYTLHRALHHSWVYPYIHERHHQYSIPIGCATFFAHPLEHILANVFPGIIGPLLTQCCFEGWCLWIGLITSTTVLAHSGILKDKRHDLHHLYRRVNYGNGFYLLDRLFGTHFRSFKQ